MANPNTSKLIPTREQFLNSVGSGFEAIITAGDFNELQARIANFSRPTMAKLGISCVEMFRPAGFAEVSALTVNLFEQEGSAFPAIRLLHDNKVAIAEHVIDPVFPRPDSTDCTALQVATRLQKSGTTIQSPYLGVFPGYESHLQEGSPHLLGPDNHIEAATSVVNTLYALMENLRTT